MIVLAQTIQNTSQVLINDSGDISSSATAHWVKAVTGLSFAASSSIVAKTTVSGAGAVSAQSLTTEEATISVDGIVSGAARARFGALTTEEASISVAGVVSGAGGISGQSLTVDNSFKVNIGGVISSSVGATLGNLILQDDSTSLVLSGSMTGSGLVTLSNITTAQGGGYKPALIVSSSAITTAADAAAIPRLVIQGTNNTGGLADYMISVSGGMFLVKELDHGTWPL